MINLSDLAQIDTVIHLANVANDPAVELNPLFSWEINVLHLTEFLQKCSRSGINSFINASSGSVYGVKEEERVTENLDLVPLSTYNKTKMAAERICLSYQSQFRVVNVRPATVCGVSPRMRFDVVVNLFALQAFQNGKITVLGGPQIRPNIHINDMVAVYWHLLTSGQTLTGNLNAGFENLEIATIAEMVAQRAKCDIEFRKSNDPRSYKQDSTKLLESGFVPKYSVSNAIDEILKMLSNGTLKDDPNWHTVNRMKTLNLMNSFASE
jgi:nucleoside-diphosphate-sugar epimerase